MKVKYTENKPIPEGYYVARVDGIEETTHPQFGPSIKWTFTIMEPQQHANTTVTAMSSIKVSPKSKLFAWLQAFGIILGADDQEFEMDSLLGKWCRVRVKNNEKKSVVEGQERTTTFSNVHALAAYIPTAASQTAQPPQQAQQNPPPQQNVVPQQDLANEEDFDF